jgi:hypothetical protein
MGWIKAKQRSNLGGHTFGELSIAVRNIESQAAALEEPEPEVLFPIQPEPVPDDHLPFISPDIIKLNDGQGRSRLCESSLNFLHGGLAACVRPHDR